MKLKNYQIDKIIVLWVEQKLGVEAIAKKTGHSKNTVRKYLRLNGYLPYQYPPDLHTGPPSLFDPSTWSTNTPNPRQQGGWFYKELEKKNKLLEKTEKQRQELEQQFNTTNQNLDQKNDEYEKLKQDHAKTIQELDESNKQKDEVREELESKNKQIHELHQKHDEDQQKLKDDLTTTRTKLDYSNEIGAPPL